MFTGIREFDAYARSLRRSVWAREFEQAARCIDATPHSVSLVDLLIGEPVRARLAESIHVTPRYPAAR